MAHHHMEQIGGATDPVCGMTVDPQTAGASLQHEGHTYYFCCSHCAERFRADPESHLSKAASDTQSPPPSVPAPPTTGAAYTCPMDPEVSSDRPGACPKCGMALERFLAAPAATSTEYVCPMHPEVVQSEPGACPKCGMALEPRIVTLEDEKNPELIDMSRRLWISVALTIPVFTMSMAEVLPGGVFRSLGEWAGRPWTELALATPVVLSHSSSFRRARPPSAAHSVYFLADFPKKLTRRRWRT